MSVHPSGQVDESTEPRLDSSEAADKPTSTAVRSWPAERFYWTILDAPSLGRSRRAAQAPPGLLAEIALDMPVPIGELHAVAIPLPGSAETPTGTQTIVIAAPREALSQARAEGVIAVVPSDLPAFVPSGIDELSSLNLLVGDFEPAALRTKRTKAHALAAGFVALVCGLIAFGLSRRANHWDQRAEAARHAISTYAPTSDPLKPSRSPDHELDRVRRINQAAAQIKPPADASGALTQLLSAWPTKAAAKPQSLSVTPTEMSLSVVIEGDPSEFLRSVKAPAGWTLDEPRINTVGGAGLTQSVSRLSLRLTRSAPLDAGGAK